jgi:hypothetical protein
MNCITDRETSVKTFPERHRLALCKKIADRHGSHISVESELRQGATFPFARKEVREKMMYTNRYIHRGDNMPLEVLLVEDSLGDVRLTQEAFHIANPLVHLNVVSDGVEALAFLKHEGAYANSPSPGSYFAGSEHA